MRCILGIGNPGNRYLNTRHNIGFQLVEDFASRLKLVFKPSKYEYYFAEGEIEEHPFSIIKPSNFVNNSGLAAYQCLNSYSISTQELLVVVDDVNLAFGEIRIRKSGGDGGHNGLNSIIYHLNSVEFPRMRLGIGENFPKGYLSDYVLSKFSDSENQELKKYFNTSSYLLESFIKGGYNFMISEYSRLKNLEVKENKASQTNERQE